MSVVASSASLAGASTSSQLQAAFAALLSDQPKLRARDAAARLGLSEAELVAAELGVTSQALRPDWKALLGGLQSVGEVLAITRNDHVVHEKKGVYQAVSVRGNMGLVVGPDIDLRLFLTDWRWLYEVTDTSNPAKPRRSLQCFDRYGQAVHKVYQTDRTDPSAWQALVDGLVDLGAGIRLPVELRPVDQPDRPDAEVDVAALHDDWGALQDTHDFFGLLGKHGVGRLQALRLVGPDFAQPLALTAWSQVVEQVRDAGLPMMVFAGNRGGIQIHSGPIQRIVRTPGWWNVLDVGFDWHVREAAVASVWLVRKPTRDGVVTSVEVYDLQGESLFWLFGVRKPGQTESAAWRALAEALLAGANA